MFGLSQSAELADRATNTLLLMMGLVGMFFALVIIIFTVLNYKQIARKVLNKKSLRKHQRNKRN